MKILLLDIETAPNVAYVWGLFKQNVAISQIVDSSYLLCYSAKWLGEDRVFFDSVQKNTPKRMLAGIHALMDEADAIIHYNGNKFDIPVLNREFLTNGFAPPSPAKQVDLYLTVRKQFKFASNKLDYVAQQLGLGKKKDTTFELWVGCMQGDLTSWAKMEEYNVQDTILLEAVYNVVRPWIKNHPNHGLHTDAPVCPNCGGIHFHRRGFAYTHAGKYQRLLCLDCGNWFRGRKSEKTQTFVNIQG